MDLLALLHTSYVALGNESKCLMCKLEIVPTLRKGWSHEKMYVKTFYKLQSMMVVISFQYMYRLMIIGTIVIIVRP